MKPAEHETSRLGFHPLAELFPMMPDAELGALADDIRANGQQQPIAIYQGAILDGRNRYKACEIAGVTPRLEEYGGDDPLAFVLSLNLKRRHLTESQRAMVAARLANMQPGRPSETAPIGAVSNADAAARLQVGEGSVDRAKTVLREGNAEIIKAVEDGTLRVSRAYADIQTAKTKANPITVPDGQFNVLVLDPPWDMQKIERDVRPNQGGFEYPTMSDEALRAWAHTVLRPMMANPSHVFMWTTQKFLPLAVELIGLAGAKYVLTMVWHKPGGYQPIGLPQYNCEFVVYGRYGSAKFIDTKAFNCCFQAPRREHSRKPDEFYDLVRRVTDGTRIDIFSREPREGFAQFGNETEKFQAAG